MYNTDENKILKIIQEELNYQEGMLFEGMSYSKGLGYRNNSF